MRNNSNIVDMPMPVMSHRFGIMFSKKIDYTLALTKTIRGANIDFKNNTFSLDLDLSFADEFLDSFISLYALASRTSVGSRDNDGNFPIGDIDVEYLDGHGGVTGKIQLLHAAISEFSLPLSYMGSGTQRLTIEGTFKDMLPWRLSENE